MVEKGEEGGGVGGGWVGWGGGCGGGGGGGGGEGHSYHTFQSRYPAFRYLLLNRRCGTQGFSHILQLSVSSVSRAFDH